MISKNNIRIKVTISRKMNTELKNIAKYEGRTVSNLVKHIIIQYLRDLDENKKSPQ